MAKKIKIEIEDELVSAHSTKQMYSETPKKENDIFNIVVILIIVIVLFSLLLVGLAM